MTSGAPSAAPPPVGVGSLPSLSRKGGPWQHPGHRHTVLRVLATMLGKAPHHHHQEEPLCSQALEPLHWGSKGFFSN